MRYLEAARSAGLRIAAVTASANGEQVIEAGGFAEYCEVRIDGLVAERDNLRGKPAPDPFLAGARALGVDASEAAVFEDAISGVQAGRAGNFGFVIGVNRVGQAEALRAHGADIVVDDLAELLDDDAGARSAPPAHDLRRRDATHLLHRHLEAAGGRLRSRSPGTSRVAVRPVQRPHRAARQSRGG
ncbi:MAG: HAD-IA family hydrolase [Geodermatophilaceae bacterium]